MKFVCKIVEKFCFHFIFTPFRFQFAWRYLVIGVLVFGSGCGTSEVLLTYSPQENVDELEKARGIGVKIIVNDLREEKKLV